MHVHPLMTDVCISDEKYSDEELLAKMNPLDITLNPEFNQQEESDGENHNYETESELSDHSNPPAVYPSISLAQNEFDLFSREIKNVYGEAFHQIFQSTIVYDNTIGQYVERNDERRLEEVEMGICGGVAITGHDLITLYPRRKLNDTIISAYLQLIATRSELEKVLPINTFFYAKMSSVGYEKGVKRWFKKKNIFEYNILLFPIHNGEHWSIVVADLSRRLFFYYDSLKFPTDEDAKLYTRGYVGHVKCFIEGEAKTKFNVDYYCNDFDIVFVNEPVQNNHYDCGVFLCCYAEFYCRHDRSLSFSQSEMYAYRMQILGEILFGRLFDRGCLKTVEMETQLATTSNQRNHFIQQNSYYLSDPRSSAQADVNQTFY
ncbi:hypothetical protein M3Y94_01071200 [Aphelenchoides besseyi]|nr:hypothetical protein M3Y94_01071200 [Aphelenchoides besseyi]KAI6216394.1 ULP-PROTEASE domain-containing protein [Aphelenchoides besseyi]